MKKIDLAYKLIKLLNNIDEKAFIESDDRLYWISNKTVLLNVSPEKLIKRSTKTSLEFMVNLCSKYQK